MSTIKIIKRKAKGFFKTEDMVVIKEAIQTCHNIMTNTSILIRSYYLKWFQEHHPIQCDTDILTLTKEHFNIASNIVQGSTSLSVRKNLKDEKKIVKQKIFEDMSSTFLEMYNRLPGEHTVKSKYSLTHILNYSIDNLMTAYKTNITTNFVKYAKKYIKCDLLCQNVNQNDAKTVAWKVVQHYLYDEPVEDVEITKLISKYDFLFPEKQKSDKPRCWDVCVYPWIYLYKMVMINQCLETDFNNVPPKFRKLYNPLPFHSSFVPMHIRLDTSGISQLLMTGEKIKMFKELFELENNVCLNMSTKADMLSSFKKLFDREPTSKKEEGEYATSVWSFLTNLETCKQLKDVKKSLKNSHESKKWVFDNAVITDGISISFQIIKEEKFGRKSLYKKNEQTDKEDTKSKKGKKQIQQDYGDKLEVTKQNKMLACDPGKNDILTITDGYKTICYTKGQRDQETYLKVRKKITLSKKRKVDLETYETQIMNRFSKQSCLLSNFYRYVCSRKRKEVEFTKLYSHPVFRQFKFTNYVKVKSSEDKFKNKIMRTFTPSNAKTIGSCSTPTMVSNAQKTVLSSTEIIIGWGNWGKSPNCLKGIGPTPGIGIKRRFGSIFNTVTVDEHMTSKTCPCCKNVTLKVHNKKHHLLRCTNEDCKSRWWNRNVAGSVNILDRFLKLNYPETETSGNG